MGSILSAKQLKDGATVKRDRLGTLTQPVQMLPREEKDEEWAAHNLDYLEMIGLKQIKRNARRLLKNYKLAAGIIDKSDYLCSEDNETAELMDVLTKEDESALELKFYPIIPNIINVLVNEFAKRNDKITYRGVDELSFNELLDAKKGMIEESLLAQAEQDVLAQMEQMGLAPDSEEGAQLLSPENLKTLPQIQDFFHKGSYQSIYEEWAQRQHHADEERFHLREMEVTGFRDMLITDREFWHFRMNDDDYELEQWNPVLTFYHKSPGTKYVSQGNHVGKFDLMSIADVIDTLGWKMNQEQLESLQNIYPIKAAGYAIHGVQNDGSFYDPSKSYKWNREGPSLAMRQWNSVNEDFLLNGDDVLSRILAEGDDMFDTAHEGMMRVTTAYWKSQLKVGHLTYTDPDTGLLVDMIVDETFKITTKPEYDTRLIKKKCRETLIWGQHVDWIWINQVWGGTKIGMNRAGFYGNTDADQFSPIYLDVKPLPFQFKGDYTLYGCKLPVEGCVYGDRNTRSNAVVDSMKPYQIGFNMVNNQIADILVDELGSIIVIDQNTLPKHSLGEDWGGDPYQKSFVAMKNFQMLPLDTTLKNTEAPMNFQHYQVLNMEQTNRLLTRVQLAQHFKQQAFEAIGFSPERMGAVNAQQTATGVEAAQNNSYVQTEHLFTQHSEYLMPRVHQMRTDLAQYYHSTNPSVRLSYLTSMDERVNFQINGTELLGRDFNVFVSTKVNTRQITEQIRNLALTNNTAGASIYDLANLIKSDSLAEIDRALKAVDEKMQQQRLEDQQAMVSAEEQRQAGENERHAAELEYKRWFAEGEWKNNLDEAEIKGSGFQTPDDSADYMEGLKIMENRRKQDADLNYRREKDLNDRATKQQELGLKKEELATRKQIADKQVQVAMVNKNQYDKPKPKPKK